MKIIKKTLIKKIYNVPDRKSNPISFRHHIALRVLLCPQANSWMPVTRNKRIEIVIDLFQLYITGIVQTNK